jgi:hypothetical protein
MFDRALSLLMAVCLALLIWIYTRSREQDALEVQVPVEVVLSPKQVENYNLEVLGPRHLTLTFTGPPLRVRELHMMSQRKELQIVKTITVPEERLNESKITDAVIIEPSDINAPIGVTPIVPESKGRIPYVLHRVVERRLPVKFDSLRELPPGPILIDPPTVLVRGPREVLDRMQHINTEPAELPTLVRQSDSILPAFGRATIKSEIEGRPVKVSPAQVTVRVPGQARKVYELTDVPVQFLVPANFPLRPRFFDERGGKVNVRLIGPVQSELPKVVAYVDLSNKPDKPMSGLGHDLLEWRLPKDFQLEKPERRVISYELLVGDFMPKGLGLPGAPDAMVPGGNR